MKKIAALIALAGIAAAANAQHTRNALVYGARAVGDVAWNFGSFNITNTTDTNPITFEVAVFADWQTGAGFSAATYKAYVDCNNLTDSVAIVDDPANGASPSDGRQGVFNYTAATQKVLSTRNIAVGGSGFRVTGSADTAADASAGGAMFFNQSTPVGNPNFNTDDHVLGYRFNVTLAYDVLGRSALVKTPLIRVGGFSTYNSLAGGTTTDYKANMVIDNLDLTATWIPAPSALAVLMGAAGFASRRRR
jgi:hypothetical protein